MKRNSISKNNSGEGMFGFSMGGQNHARKCQYSRDLETESELPFCNNFLSSSRTKIYLIPFLKLDEEGYLFFKNLMHASLVKF